MTNIFTDRTIDLHFSSYDPETDRTPTTRIGAVSMAELTCLFYKAKYEGLSFDGCAVDELLDLVEADYFCIDGHEFAAHDEQVKFWTDVLDHICYYSFSPRQTQTA